MSIDQIPASPVFKLAVPMADGRYSPHFGGATQFWIYEGDRTSAELPGQFYPAPKHEPGALPRWLAAQGVQTVVIAQIGERALRLLADAGIEAVHAPVEDSPEALARAYLEGRLARVNRDDVCCQGHHHGHHHHGHHHHPHGGHGCRS